MGTKTLNPASFSVLCFNAFKDETPLPCKLAAINDDALTIHIMNTLIEPNKNISSVAIELGEDMAMFAAAVASGLQDITAEKNFHKISDMISSIRWTEDDDIFEKIQTEVQPYNNNKEYSKLAQQLMTILHTGYIF